LNNTEGMGENEVKEARVRGAIYGPGASKDKDGLLLHIFGNHQTLGHFCRTFVVNVYECCMAPTPSVVTYRGLG
jgi:hypothetical protein